LSTSVLTRSPIVVFTIPQSPEVVRGPRPALQPVKKTTICHPAVLSIPRLRLKLDPRRTPLYETLLAMGPVGSTRIEVSGHRSDLGRWRAAQPPFEPRLRDYILPHFGSEGFLPKPLHARHLPALEVTIVLSFAAPHRIIGPLGPKRTTGHRNAWIVALQHHHRIRQAFGAPSNCGRGLATNRLPPNSGGQIFPIPRRRSRATIYR
jgi:hypothetical protein